MSNRPAIPAEIAREILLESGHRCAVCGTPCPLERAHIIPWHKSRDHKSEDLICLCANCHERADRENWGEKTLWEYKRMPWVLRQYKNVDSVPESAVRLEITIGMDSSERFDDKNQRWLQYAIAAFLEIPPHAVQIVAIAQGSVKVTIELPARSASRLMIACQRHDPELLRHLAPLILLDLRQDAAVRERIRHMYDKVVELLITYWQETGPGTRKLIQSLVETEQRSTRQQTSVTGQGHQVVVVGGNVGGNIIVTDQTTSDQQLNGVSENIGSDRACLARLREVLDAHFNEEELRTLCYDLDVDYDNLPAQGKVNKARELIAYLERHGHIPELLRMGEQLRPDISWSDTH